MQLDGLTSDGDTVELEDGRSLRLRVEHDMDYDPFEESDTYGKIGSGRRDGNTGHNARPQGFDGNAERISILNDMIWWQPPADVKRSDPGFAQLRQLVSDLASFGAYVVTLELLSGEDAYGRPIVVDVASLGGIDSLDDGYITEVVRDLAAELSVAVS